jgi:hypothetical protein
MTLSCRHCAREFHIKPSRLDGRKVQFCGRACRLAHGISSLEERFWARVKKTATCWIWQGQRGGDYGRLQLPERGGKRSTDMAHRFAYKALVGEIPEGLDLDHLCRNTLCVNPAHLEAVTSEVNVMRGIGVGAKNAAKTHCKHGHPLFGPNLTPRKGRKGRVARECLICRRARGRRYLERKKAEAA